MGPLHVPTALRASAQERSGLAAHFVAPLWRAPLVQSAKGRALIEKRGIFTLRVQTPLRPLHVIVAALEHVHPSRLHSGGSRRSHQGLRATLQGRAGGTELRVACLVPVLCCYFDYSRCILFHFIYFKGLVEARAWGWRNHNF